MAEDYNLWYRHTGQKEPSIATSNYLAACSLITKSEIEEDLKAEDGSTLYITHLLVRQDIPPLSRIAPYLRDLCIRELPSVHQLRRVNGLDYLAKIDLEGNDLSDGLPEGLLEPLIQVLKDLNLANCQLKQIPRRLSEQETLERLILEKNVFTAGLPDELFEKMENLKELRLKGCNVRTIPRSLLNLFNLELLDLRENSISNGLPQEVFYNLTSLRVLYLGKCTLTSLPESLTALQGLEVLVTSHNNFSAGLPDDVFKNLPSLRNLTLSSNKMTKLPTSISSLQTLEILYLSNNPLKELPENLFENLTSLKEIHMGDCQLTSLPDSLRRCSDNLKTVYIPRNSFEPELPAVLCSLAHLEKLVINNNQKLLRLSPQLFNIESLTDVECSDCISLEYPPYSVAERGYGQIKQYFKDMAESGEHKEHISVTTAAVIGLRMAGKTSFIQSLKTKNRILSNREEGLPYDETTRVFNVEPVEIEGLPIRVFDFGGDEAYHATYQLTVRDNCIPFIVVNMEHFVQKSNQAGFKEGARLVAFDWLSHFYLAHPNLAPPILVITHRDKFDDSTFMENHTHFLEACDTLKAELYPQGRVAENHSKISHLADPSTPLFLPENIFVVSKVEIPFQGIKECILQRMQGPGCRSFIPLNWYHILKFFEHEEFRQKAFLELDFLKEKFLDHMQLDTALGHAHMAGYVLWYHNVDELRPYIFHQIEYVTELLRIVFTHSEDETWSGRRSQFVTFSPAESDEIVDEQVFDSWMADYRKSRTFSEGLLVYLIKTECRIPFDLAIILLSNFQLIYGPIATGYGNESTSQRTQRYLIPSLALSKADMRWCSEEGTVVLRIIISFKGLNPPHYGYHQMTVSMLKLYKGYGLSIAAHGNGATVRKGNVVIAQLIHDSKRKQILIQNSADATNIHLSWRRLIDTVVTVLRFAHDSWKAVKSVCEFICPHCLLKENEQRPGRLVNKGFLIQLNQMVKSFTSDTSICTNRDDEEAECLAGNDVIPSSLINPCTELSGHSREKLNNFLRETASAHKERMIKRLCDWLTANRSKEEIDLELDTTYNTPAPNDSMYPMTSTKGRALILSNNFQGQREGSEHDYTNVKRMLQAMGFITVGEHKDYTTRDMEEAIQRETNVASHESYGMFCLVITSHGDRDHILGCGGDEDRIRPEKILELLSPPHFMAMEDRPKLVIIQCCSGENVDGVQQTHQIPASGELSLPSLQPEARPGMENVMGNSVGAPPVPEGHLSSRESELELSQPIPVEPEAQSPSNSPASSPPDSPVSRNEDDVVTNSLPALTVGSSVPLGSSPLGGVASSPEVTPLATAQAEEDVVSVPSMEPTSESVIPASGELSLPSLQFDAHPGTANMMRYLVGVPPASPSSESSSIDSDGDRSIITESEGHLSSHESDPELSYPVAVEPETQSPSNSPASSPPDSPVSRNEDNVVTNSSPAPTMGSGILEQRAVPHEASSLGSSPLGSVASSPEVTPPATAQSGEDVVPVPSMAPTIERVILASGGRSLTRDHFLILKASQPGFAAIRDTTVGSWMIRALVLTFYRHAHHAHLEELLKMVQQTVRELSLKHGCGHIPETTSTLTGMRSIYLFSEPSDDTVP